MSEPFHVGEESEPLTPIESHPAEMLERESEELHREAGDLERVHEELCGRLQHLGLRQG